MTSVASFAISRMRRSAAATIFFALVLAGIFQPDVSLVQSVELNPAVQSGDKTVGETDFTLTDGQAWVDCLPVVECHAQGSHLQLPSIRLEPTFGDTTWSSVAADQGHAAAMTAQRRARSIATHCTAPLWVSLQARDIRLQI